MSKRKSIPKDVETKVLVDSARICPFCYGLEGDSSLKQGQLAHIDHDSSNNKLENLVFLCLPHHDKYDSRTSQSKGFTEHELREYRTQLYEFVERRREVNNQKLMLDFGGKYLEPLLTQTARLKSPFDKNIYADHLIRLNSSVEGENSDPYGALFISYKTSVFMREHPITPLPKERWLLFQSVLDNGYALKIQVRAYDDSQIKFLQNTLRGIGRGCNLAGYKNSHGTEFLSIDNIEGEEVLRLSLHVAYPSYSSVMVGFRVTYKAADELAQYLDDVGFSKPVE